jgi:hypothetical protein
VHSDLLSFKCPLCILTARISMSVRKYQCSLPSNHWAARGDRFNFVNELWWPFRVFVSLGRWCVATFIHLEVEPLVRIKESLYYYVNKSSRPIVSEPAWLTSERDDESKKMLTPTVGGEKCSNVA